MSLSANVARLRQLKDSTDRQISAVSDGVSDDYVSLSKTLDNFYKDFGTMALRFFVICFADLASRDAIFGQGRMIDVLPRKILSDLSFVVPFPDVEPEYIGAMLKQVDSLAKFHVFEVQRSTYVKDGLPSAYPKFVSDVVGPGREDMKAVAFLTDQIKPLNPADYEGLSLNSAAAGDPFIDWALDIYQGLANWGFFDDDVEAYFSCGAALQVVFAIEEIENMPNW